MSDRTAREVIATEAFECTESTKKEAAYFAEWLETALREAGFAIAQRDVYLNMLEDLRTENATLKALARSAEDDCQRAITEKQKAEHDLKCLQESTVDSKAYAALKARVMELERQNANLRKSVDLLRQKRRTTFSSP